MAVGERTSLLYRVITRAMTSLEGIGIAVK
jgi:hypothetical protein